MKNNTVFKVKTKGNAEPRGKSRVFYTAHPADAAQYLDRICDDIFKSQDCAIYYLAEHSEESYAAVTETDLEHMNLFVIPVTLKLLSEKNRALDVDLKYALAHHIPVLPLVMENDLDKLFTARFGELQYLTPDSTDTTAISYEEKLGKYLNNVLVNDDLRNRIQAAFDSYVFLSYRKKDRAFANNLMRRIHKTPRCRDVAIWYDEFLTPGENYNHSIEDALLKSRLFVLLVTPNLLEDPNYVMKTEYPEAKNRGKRILPVEMADTDKQNLRDKYPDIPECVSGYDSEALENRLNASFSDMPARENTDKRMHDYLIGMAYLEGIDVETNRELGLEMITHAAEAGLLDAMDTLANIYHDGIGVNIDWEKSLEWLKKGTYKATEAFSADDERLLKRRHALATGYYEAGHYKSAITEYEAVYNITRKIYGENDPRVLTTLGNMASVFSEAGDYVSAINTAGAVYTKRAKIFGENDPDTLRILNTLAVLFSKTGNYTKSAELLSRVYETTRKSLGDLHPDTIRSLNTLGLVCSKTGDHNKAVSLLEKAYELSKESAGEKHPHTLSILDNLALVYGELGDYNHALVLITAAYDGKCAALGKDHPSALLSLNNKALIYINMGAYQKALALHETAYNTQRITLGEAHPDTQTSLLNIASCYGSLGNLPQEIAILNKLLELCKKTRGEEHPNTLTVLNNLALAHTNIGNFKVSLDIQHQLYDSMKKVFGEEHPRTLTVLNNTALNYIHLKDYQKALSIYESLYPKRCALLGKEHPDTLTTRQNMAYCYGETGDIDRSLEILTEVHASRKKVLGAEHPDTISTFCQIVYLHIKRGDTQTATVLAKELYELQKKTLGPKHPITLQTQQFLNGQV